MKKTRDRALILVNTGTPEKPEKPDVREYLAEFLNDPYVIDIPLVLRKILVNGIIIPFRTPRSTALYKQLWTNNGSPLLTHLNNLVTKINQNTSNQFDVYAATRYGKPSLRSVLASVATGYDDITILPLFPHYARSTTGSIENMVNATMNNKQNQVRLIKQFYNKDLFLESFAQQIQKYKPHHYDFILFSYHGLPIRHINKVHPGISENSCSCDQAMPSHGEFCYKATCYETTRLLAKRLGLDNRLYTTSFQSRLTRNWLNPFTDEKLKELAKNGKRKVLIVAPSFVADCLETIVEIGIGYKHLFKAAGGEKITLVESLNDSNEWVKAIIDLVR